MKWLWLILAGLLVSCVPGKNPQTEFAAKTSVNAVLDEWHKAAATADFEIYFNLMTDSAIFIGTDASEYWDKKQFMDYSRPHFERGRAWTFVAVKRNIYFNPERTIAWFDEQLDTQNMGECRGSGVLQYQNGTWKIEHYNLSIPLPNELSGSVVNQIKNLNK